MNSSGEVVVCNIYSDVEEVGDTYLTISIDGSEGYIRLGDIGDEEDSGGRVESNNTIYSICKSGITSGLSFRSAENLDVGCYNIGTATVGDYVIFGGGYYYTNKVTAYDQSLTKILPTVLTYSVESPSAGGIGGYALFCGGQGSGLGAVYSNIDKYDTSLTKSTLDNLSYSSYDKFTANIGESHLIFVGGFSYNDADRYTEAFAYNTSLTRTNATSISTSALFSNGGVSIGEYALFSGFYYSSSSASTVNAYNASLTRTVATSLSVDRYNGASASVGDYAVIVGGYYNNTGERYATCDVYNKSLTRSSGTSLSDVRNALAGASTTNYAVFAGGTPNGSSPLDICESYDSTLTKTIQPNMDNPSFSLKGIGHGKNAFFVGGRGVGTRLSYVQVFSEP